MVRFVIITHGEFGAYLVEAAEEIVGRQTDGIRAVSISPRWAVDEVRSKIAEAIEKENSPEGLIIAIDIPGGTPANVVLPMVKDMPHVKVVSGVNLYMLVSAFGRRSREGIEEVFQRMMADGQKSIRDIKAMISTPCR